MLDAVQQEEPKLRMKDLVEQTGLPRQVIHFYIQQGLLPAGRKTGRNMAFYGPEHVERIKLVRRLQHERFLPLKAIKALLEDQHDAFTPAQRRLLVGVKQRLAIAGNTAPPEIERAVDLCARTGVALADVMRMVELGVLGAAEDPSGVLLVAKQDAWIVETWAEMQNAGFTAERGFSVEDLLLYEEAIDKLFRAESVLILRRLAQLSPEEVAPMIERALPVIHGLVTRLHDARIRNFFASMG